MPDSVRLGLVQMSMVPDRDANLARAMDLTREAAAQGAQVVCLPELFLSPYFCQTESTEPFGWAEAIPGPTTAALEPLAAELDVVIVASLFEKRARGLYHNTAAVLDGTAGYQGKYRKMHIPDDPLYYEKYYFAPGDLGFRSWETTRGDLGVLVCWDQWYPEAARATALQGADVLFYPTAIGWHPGEKDSHGAAQREAWITIQRSHAVANGVFVVAVNRTGFEPTSYTDPDAEAGGRGIQFWGSSFVAGPDGQILGQMGETEEGVLVVDADLSAIDEQRHGWPFLRDRRVDAYAPIGERFGR
ncbi:MAG TPA: carbon-nitrogen hydrolase [Bacteroidetes bacterium]|nr:carbon-nitrogen hydrolase [Bacteroidota bacterium]HIL58866.1 carbon-nitrogen hydrolase [Rhodothermales bacterium]